MKKIFSVFAAMALALSAFMFTGCDEIANEFDCYDTWYEYTYTYEADSGIVELSCYLAYQRDGVDTSKILASGVELVDGLNVVIIPGADADSNVLNAICEGLADNGKFLFKSYPEGAGSEDFAFTMNRSTWVMIWQHLKTKDSFDDRGSMPPDLLKKKTSKNLAEDGSVNWKSILASVLVGAIDG
ncbi:MAG: hypothetical protein K6E78_06510 [Treponema sp.]|nr:hypothetical protein [Treponema sp.]